MSVLEEMRRQISRSPATAALLASAFLTSSPAWAQGAGDQGPSDATSEASGSESNRSEARDSSVEAEGTASQTEAPVTTEQGEPAREKDDADEIDGVGEADEVTPPAESEEAPPSADQLAEPTLEETPPQEPADAAEAPVDADQTAEAAPVEAEEEETNTKKELPESLGPLQLVSESGDYLRFGNATQLRASLEGDDLSRGLRDSEGSLAWQRQRFIMAAGLLERRLGFVMQVNLTPSQAELIDIIGTYRVAKQLVFSMGQMKVPFSSYRTQSFTGLVLADWGETSRWFGAERQIGANIGTSKQLPSRFGYDLGLYHGENSRAAFSNRLAKVYGEKVPNRSKFNDAPGYGSPHPEFVGRVRLQSDPFTWWRNSDSTRKALRYQLSFSGAYDVRPDAISDAAIRLAPEFLLKAHGLSLHAIYYMAWAKLTEFSDNATAFGYHGPQVELAYRFNRTWELAARYGSVKVAEKVTQDAELWAQEQIDEAEDADEAARYDQAGAVDIEQEITGGLNIYIIGDSLKLNTDFSVLPQRTRDDWFADFRMRTQVQLVF